MDAESFMEEVDAARKARPRKVMEELWSPTQDSAGSGATEEGLTLQYSCLENHMDRGAWRAIIHSVTKGWSQLK